MVNINSNKRPVRRAIGCGSPGSLELQRSYSYCNLRTVPHWLNLEEIEGNLLWNKLNTENFSLVHWNSDGLDNFKQEVV